MSLNYDEVNEQGHQETRWYQILLIEPDYPILWGEVTPEYLARRAEVLFNCTQKLRAANWPVAMNHLGAEFSLPEDALVIPSPCDELCDGCLERANVKKRLQEIGITEPCVPFDYEPLAELLLSGARMYERLSARLWHDGAAAWAKAPEARAP
jgi:hypothetical protein